MINHFFFPSAGHRLKVSHRAVYLLGENCYLHLMNRDERHRTANGAEHNGPTARVLAQGADWYVREYICRAGPEDRPFEEQHQWASIAAVVSGSFQYRSDAGKDILYPGSFLLGNYGSCYECGHDHSRGDRCISIGIAPHYFQEIAASNALNSRFRFGAASLPAMPRFLPLIAELESLAAAKEFMAIEESIICFVGSLLKEPAQCRSSSRTPSHREAARIARTIRFIEENTSENFGLDDLAAEAGLSKYHFLRTFRQEVGATPYRYLLNIRLRKAAVRIAASAAPISGIAFDEGFGDLSTFNNRFRAVFGASPSAFRKKYAPSQRPSQEKKQ
ncbi:MAG: AraC family transcriptional regulator [Rhodomicrobium sp.]